MNGIVIFRTLLGVNLKAGVEALPGTAVGSVLSACYASCEALLALVQFLATAKQCNKSD